MPPTTTRYGDILRGLFEGVKNPGGTSPYSVVELDTLQQQFNEMAQRDAMIKSMQTGEPMSLKMQRITAEETQFHVSPARAILFSFTTVTSVPNGVQTLIDFTDTRGLINSQSTNQYGCAKWVEGYTDRFTKQDWVPALYPIIFFGDFGFGTDADGSRYIYIEFFDKDDVSLGGYSFDVDASPSDWTNFAFLFLDRFDDGDYCKFWVWQDSGAARVVTSANFGFMLG